MLIDVFLKAAVLLLAVWAVVSLVRKRPQALRPFDASAHSQSPTQLMTFDGSSDGSHGAIDASHHGGFGGHHGGFGGQHGGFDGGGHHGGGFDGGGGHSGH